MPKFPRYVIVIHNVLPDCKQTVLNHVSGAQRSAVAVEPYNDQEGQHVHIQIEFPNQRHKTALLKEFKGLSAKIVAPRPEGIEGDWGRVQVSKMYGTFEQATQYLVNPTKDKKVDPNVVVSSKEDDVFYDRVRLHMSLCEQLYQHISWPELGRMCSVLEYLDDPMCEDRTGYYTNIRNMRNDLEKVIFKIRN